MAMCECRRKSAGVRRNHARKPVLWGLAAVCLPSTEAAEPPPFSLGTGGGLFGNRVHSDGKEGRDFVQ